MKHQFLKITALFLSLVFLFSLSLNILAFTVNAAERESITATAEKKVFSTATLDDDFADDTVLIVLNQKETQKFKHYSKEDFAGIKITKVENLTASTAEIVKAKIESKSETRQSIGMKNSNKTFSIDSLDVTKDAYKKPTLSEKLSDEDIDAFRSILYIELEEKGKANVLSAIKKLETNEDYLYVGPNYNVHLCAEPNDVKYSEQWGLTKIQAPTAWDTRTSVLSVLVGVVDTGIQADHPDLANQIYSSKHRDFTTGVVAGTAISVDNLTDLHGHGTHVAGIIGAQGNNSIGGTGVCWSIKLVSLRVLDAMGNGNTLSVINALNYAQTANIDILNMSICSYNYDVALETAIRNYTGLIVASAGNENNNSDEVRVYPASFTSEFDNVISVGASDSSDERSIWVNKDASGKIIVTGSNYGKTTVDIFAPGTDIYSTLRNGGYGEKSGTSMAAPFVAGVAALMMATSFQLQPEDVKYIINYTSDSKTSLANLCISGGRLNAARAIEAAENTRPISVKASNRYTERKMTISKEVGYKDYIVTFANAGRRVFQTFGANTLSHDGFLEIYDINGTRLDYDDDSGYERNALISYYFEADTAYRIRVKFCATSAKWGDIRLAILPSQSYDTYEDIDGFTDNVSEVTGSLVRYRVNMMTYKYTTSQDLTMRVSSEIDTYLYIIDPSSVELCFEVLEGDDELVTSCYSSLENDDWEDEDGEEWFNPRLRKIFEAGIPYLVIVSAYNPTSDTSTGNYSISFE